jgi:hypothetical protein
LGKKRNGYRIFVCKPEGKTEFGRFRRRWVNNTKMDFEEIEWEAVHRMSGSGQGKLAGSCEGGNELTVSIKCWEYLN